MNKARRLWMIRHRSKGDCRAFSVCSSSGLRTSSSAFRWGSQYTHFFYAIQANAPFSLLATSNEFCLQAAADDKDCDSAGFKGQARAIANG